MPSPSSAPRPDPRAALQLIQQGRSQEAAALCREILARQPSNAQALHLSGTLALQAGQPGEAEALLRRAIAADPRHPAYRYDLGNLLLMTDRVAEAEPLLRAAATAAPQIAEVQLALATCLARLAHGEEALQACHAALRLKPDLAAAHNTLGNLMKEADRPADAAACYRRARDLAPRLPDPHFNLGLLAREANRFDEAIGHYRDALAVAPGHAPAHYNLAIALLLAGDYAAGWEEYEWRWAAKRRPSRFPQPLWNGEPLAGRRLLVHAEQGLGDSLHMLRYLPALAAQAETTLLELQAPLLPLVAAQGWPLELIAQGDLSSGLQGARLPPFDLHCPIMSLPRAFRTRPDSIPAETPYLVAPAARVDAWRGRLADLPGLKVGLVWGGNPQQVNDRNRSLDLPTLAPLLALPGVSWVSLQVGSRASELAALAPSHLPPTHLRPHDSAPGQVLDLSGKLTDFAETAAVAANLDLVVSVDTSVGHLAGALGRPTFILLSFAADWRWPTDRADNPWYPSLRVFRQDSLGAWEPVVARAAAALDAFRPQT